MDLKSKFRRVCINAHPCRQLSHDGKERPFLYKRDDLSRWSREAFDRGEEYFFTEPVDPEHIYGKLRLCEPKYVYRLEKDLTEEEYNQLF